MSNALYTFALAFGDLPQDWPLTPDGQNLQMLKTPLGTAIVADISANVVSRLASADTITGLQDVADWLLFHDHVTKHVNTDGVVYPFGFATVFSSEAALQEALAAESQSLMTYFRHVSGADEWAIKVSIKKQTDTRLEDAARATSGLNYLQRRKAHTVETQDSKTARAEALIEPLQNLSRDWASVQSTLTPAPDLEVIGNFAALVDRSEINRFHALVDTQSQTVGSDTVVTCTGPWPAFSFRPKLETIAT